MSEISESTQSTAENIQDSNNDTVELSKEMVAFANNSDEVVRGSLNVAENMRKQTEVIRNKNKVVVVDSMKKLQNKTNLLALNASAAAGLVNDSIKTADVQSELIMTAAENFFNIDSNVKNLTNNIKETDNKVDSLAKSNDILVENISQLLAFNEEVTANSMEAKNLNEENAESAENARKLLDEMLETLLILNKYSKD